MELTALEFRSERKDEVRLPLPPAACRLPPLKDLLRHRGMLACIALFLALFAWYHAPAFSFYFSQDDFPLLVSSRPGWVSPWFFFVTGSPREYRPLTQHFFFYFNQLLFGQNPSAHHAMVLLVHLANTLLVAWLASRWLALWAALPAAALFAFHPIHFYEVFWVSGISQSGYVFFLLCTLLLFSRFLAGRQRSFLAASLATAIAAFLSKEDAVMVPAILVLVAVLEPGRSGRSLSRAAATIPFWVLLAAYLWVRFGLLGFGIPHEGVYRFGADLKQISEKLDLYRVWLTIHWKLYVPALALTGAALFEAGRTGRFALREIITKLSFFLGLALLSIAPTLLIPGSAEHYLSVSSAALGLALAAIVLNLPSRWTRAVATATLLFFFGWSALQGRRQHLDNPSLFVPIPAKAEICERWMGQLRQQQPPAGSACAFVFRDLPLESWERGWFDALVRMAWNRPAGELVVHTSGMPEPAAPSECAAVWSFQSGDAVRIQ